MALRYQELVPSPDVVLLQEIGHYPQLEDPEGVLGAFMAFQDHLARASGDGPGAGSTRPLAPPPPRPRPGATR
jgi:hypothetical protein